MHNMDKWQRIAGFLLVVLCCTEFLQTDTFALASKEQAESVVYRTHSTDNMKIALTFDDGPHGTYTDEILDILAEYQVKATFFIVGQNATRYPEILAREIREGHEIGNHTYNHCYLPKKNPDAILSEIIAAERQIYETIDYRTKLFRPPGGLYDETVCTVAGANDYTIVLWTVDPKDWAHTPTEEIIEHVLSNVKSGDIILFHDMIGGNSPTPGALKVIIPELLSRGFKLVTVSELIHSG